MIGCQKAAEHMLSTSKFYTAAELGKELNVTAMIASGFIYNIRKGKKYQTIETPTPNRRVKLISIQGRKLTKESLWSICLFNSKI